MNETLEIKIKEIESMIAINKEKIVETLKDGQKLVDDLREKVMSIFNLDEKYKFTLVNEATLRIQFETGEFWKNNTPVIASMYFKYNYEELENKESFTINTCADDSFDPTGENYLVDYYSLIGLFCFNKDVTERIKEIMRTVYYKVNHFRNFNFYLRQELVNLKNECKNHEYVLIQTNSKSPIPSYFIYKGKPVIILGCGSYMECYDIYFKNYKGTENKYEIVESNKIQF